MRKNEILELEIERHTADGQGIAHLPDGRVCFVAGALAGEVCRVRLMKLGKTVAWGRVEERLSTSAERVESDCPYYPKCGGCQTRHMSYQAETAAKRQHVLDTLSRIGGISREDIVIFGSENTERYRNKAVFPIGGTVNAPMIGFYRERSHDLVDIADCLLQHPAATTARQVVLTWMKEEGIAPYDEGEKTGIARHLLVRTNCQDEALICLLCHCAVPPKSMAALAQKLTEEIAGFRGLVFGSNMRGDNVIFGDRFETISGADHITETLCGIEYKIGVNSFFQINRNQTEILYKKAAEYAALTEEEILLDLYCGIGSIGLSMAKHTKEIIGVEVVENAVKNARENAAENQIKNASFFCGDAGEIATRLVQEHRRPDVVVFDPPRKGLSLEAINAAVAMEPSRMVYVSCDPATFARDVRILREKGYELTELTAVDLFPRTKHVECVGRLIKIEG